MTNKIGKKSNNITHIAVHISDSPDSMYIGAKKIKEWHLARNFKDIGYHFVVARDGSIQKGRSLYKEVENGHKRTLKFNPGAHVKGHNHYTIGVCVVGRNKMTTLQKLSLVKLLRSLQSEFGISYDKVMGHSELDSESGKTCPAPMIDMNILRGELLFKDAEHVDLDWNEFEKDLSTYIKEIK